MGVDHSRRLGLAGSDRTTLPTSYFTKSAGSGGSITFVYDNTTYFTHDGTDIEFRLPAASGSFIVKMAATPSDHAVRIHDSSGTLLFAVTNDGNIYAPNLPTSDPGTPGLLYRTGGAVMVSV